MIRPSALALVLLPALLLASCAGLGRGGHGDRIEGVVVAEFDGEEQPVAHAHVEIHLPDNEDLVGVATTNYAGRFSINELSNPLTQSEQPLSRKQDYLVQIRSPEHYILTGTLRFEYGSEEWTFVLIHKDNSLRSDKTVTPSLNPEADATLSMGGAVRKGS